MSIDNLLQHGIESVSFISKDLAVQKTSIITNVSAFDFSGITPSMISQFSGSSPLPVANGLGDATGDITMTIENPNKEFYEIVGRKEAIISSVDTGTPAIEDSKNLNGSSVLNATTGLIIGIKAGNEANLKAGQYIIKAVSSTTVDIIYLGKNFIKKDNPGVINATPLTIATGVSVDVDNNVDASSVVNTGLELTGGSGTIAFNIGDSAIFTVGLGKESSKYSIDPSVAGCPRLFGLVVATRCASNEKNRYSTISIPLVNGIADRTFPSAREFSAIELTMKAVSTTENIIVKDHYI